MTSTTEAPVATTPVPTPSRSGARSAALLGVASLAATVANYLFLLIAGRVLGSADYGGLAALLGALTVVLLPTGAIQLAVSREVSRRVASGEHADADAFSYATFRLSLLLTLPALAVAFLLVVPVRELLGIDSTAAVATAAAGVTAMFVLPVALGVLQGYQRFGSVAILYVLPFALRLALLVPIALAGFRLGGALYAAVFAGIVSAVFAVTLIEQPLRRGSRAMRPALRPFFAYLGPVVLGVIGIAVLTNVDIVVAKARFSDTDAGAYAAASAFARVAFFLPATVLAVLFPRTAARHARGEDTDDILGRSLIVVAGLCGLLTLAYWMTGRGLVHTSFGPEFAAGGELLAPFAFAMTLYALANVLVGFHLSRGETRYAWILAAAVPVQLAVLTLVPDGMRGLVWANVAVAACVVAAHELFVGSSLPALRVGGRRLLRSIPWPRAAAREGALALVAAIAVACVLTWPLSPQLGSAFLGSIGADASGTIWWFWHLQQEGGYHLFGSTHHVLGGAPFGFQESNALNLQWLLPYYPAYLVTAVVGEVAAYNLVVLGGFVLSGVAMYAFVRWLGCPPAVSAWAGLAYMIFPAHLARAEHASLLHFEVLALTLFAAAAAAARPTALRLALVALAVLAAWLTSGYFGVMASIGAVAVAAAIAAFGKVEQRVRLLAGVFLAALTGTAVVGILSSISGTSVRAIREPEPVDLVVYGIRVPDLVVPSPGNLTFGDRLEGYWATHLHGANASETSNYLGLLTIVLAVAGIAFVVRGRRRLPTHMVATVTGLATLVVLSLLFALPSPWGPVGSWTPSRILWEVVPTFRVPSRWVAMTMTALIPIAALGLDGVGRAVERRRSGSRRRLVGAVVVGAAMIVSIAELTTEVWKKVTPTGPAPAIYDAVERTPPGVVAEYPIKYSDVYYFWQREHGREIVDGAPWGTFANDVARTLVDPDAPGTAERLALLGVTSIVTRPDSMDFFSNEPEDFPRTNWGPGYDLVTNLGGTTVWQVTAAPAPAIATLPSASFVDGVVDEDGFVGNPLTGQTGTLELWSPSAQVVRLNVDAVPQGETRTLRIRGAEGDVTFDLEGRTRLSTVVRVPRGRSFLDLRIEPAQQAGEFPLHLSAPWTEQTTEAPALVATPLDAPTSE